MTPGGYLRLRRKAAGLSITDVADVVTAGVIGRNPSSTARLRVELRSLVERVEADFALPDPFFVDRLRLAFAFDRFVLRQLVCRLDPAPELCRVCGCSALDACDDDVAGPCAWANAAHDLCTRCAGDRACANPEKGHHHA